MNTIRKYSNLLESQITTKTKTGKGARKNYKTITALLTKPPFKGY